MHILSFYAVEFDDLASVSDAYILLLKNVFEIFQCESRIPFEDISITLAKCYDEEESSKFKKADKFADIINLLLSNKSICNWFDITILKRFAYQYDISKVGDLIRDYENYLNPKKIKNVSESIQKKYIGAKNVEEVKGQLSKTVYDTFTVGDAKAAFGTASGSLSIQFIAQSFMVKCIIPEKSTSSQYCKQVLSAGYCIIKESLPHLLEESESKCVWQILMCIQWLLWFMTTERVLSRIYTRNILAVRKGAALFKIASVKKVVKSKG